MMSEPTENMGGRLPLLTLEELSATQRALYERLNHTMLAWADHAGFQSRTDDGRLIGPFNSGLFSPEIGQSFLELQMVEKKCTSLSERVREVVILSVGAVWNSDYELYAHSAAARKAGISEEAIHTLVNGGLPADLSEQEQIAQRFARQLSAEHRIGADLYSAAEQAFSRQGLLDMAYLTGIYHVTCSLLNAFEVPTPAGRS